MKLKATVSLVTLSAMAALTACGGPSGGEGDSSKETLTIGAPTIVTGLDPDEAYSRQQIGIQNLTAGTLTTIDREGKQVQMGLADSLKQNDKQYVLKLKSGLEFSDGSPLKAKDVAASFERFIANKSSPSAYIVASIEKVTAVDDLTVNFDLKKPDSALPFNLAGPAAAILPAKVIEARGKDLYKGDPPPSAGQFVVESLEKDQVTLRANTHYAGVQPATKTVIFKKITDSASRLAQVQGGGIDFADEISTKVAGQVTAPAEVHKSIAVNGNQFLLLNNTEKSLLNDVRIRQAIGVAVDRGQINKVAWSGLNKPGTGLFSSASQYANPFLPEQADVARAKELLAGTKCADGCKLQLIVSSSNETRNDVAVVVQQNLKAIGIDVTINQADSATVDKHLTEGTFDISVSNIYDLADFPSGILSQLFGPELNAFYTGYSSPEMDRLRALVVATSGSEQREWVNKVNAQFEKDLPAVPIVQSFVMSVSRVPSAKFGIDPTFFYHVG